MKLGGHLVCPAVPAVDPRPVTMAIEHRVVELVHHSVRRLERRVACMAEELPTVGVEKPRGCRRVQSPLGGALGVLADLEARLVQAKGNLGGAGGERVGAGGVRVGAGGVRVGAEGVRVGAEGERVGAEGERVGAGGVRVGAEGVRVLAGGEQVVLDAPVAAPASQAVVKLKVQRERAEARV